MNQVQLRKWAAWGAKKGPDWFVQLAPIVIGLVAFCIAHRARRAVFRNLRVIFGERELVVELRDALLTVTGFARNLTDSLCPERWIQSRRLIVRGHAEIENALEKSGLIAVTAHVGPWDGAAMTLTHLAGRSVLMLMAGEQDAHAAGVQDEIRGIERVEVLRLGASPLAALPAVAHLAEHGIVAAQMDRPFGRKRTVEAQLFGKPFAVSPGLIRLAATTGCPLVPVFMARLERGARLVEVGRPIHVPPRPNAQQTLAIAQIFLDQLQWHLEQFPTQWYHFVDDSVGDRPT